MMCTVDMARSVRNKVILSYSSYQTGHILLVYCYFVHVSVQVYLEARELCQLSFQSLSNSVFETRSLTELTDLARLTGKQAL